jgi:acyl dehydratase
VKRDGNPIYFADLVVGSRYVSGVRKISEADLLTFADLSGDHHPIHVDADFAARSPFGQRILHGPFGVALAVGLFGEFDELRAASIALTDIREWKFHAPVFVGDELHLEMVIASKQLSRSARQGHVERQMKLINQSGVVVQSGSMGLLFAVRADHPTDSSA